MPGQSVGAFPRRPAEYEMFRGHLHPEEIDRLPFALIQHPVVVYPLYAVPYHIRSADASYRYGAASGEYEGACRETP